MYSGEIEVQAKRKTIAILQEETNKILSLSRKLAIMTDAIIHDNKDGIRESSDKMNFIESDIMTLRKQSTREAKPNFEIELKEMIGMIIDILFKINEMSRALTIKPENTIELASEIRRIEMEVDKKYRKLTIKALDQITNQKDLFLFKDTIEGFEGIVDKCQQASNSFTILALSI